MLFATVSRGKKVGTRLLPHRFKDNRYRVQLGKQGPYIPVTDHREIPSYLANGYSLHMSNKGESRGLSSDPAAIYTGVEHEPKGFVLSGAVEIFTSPTRSTFHNLCL